MKKQSLILIGVAVISAIVYISWPSSNASREIAQSNTPAVTEPSSTVQTSNLHFDGLHANPNVQ